MTAIIDKRNQIKPAGTFSDEELKGQEWKTLTGGSTMITQPKQSKWHDRGWVVFLVGLLVGLGAVAVHVTATYWIVRWACPCG